MPWGASDSAVMGCDVARGSISSGRSASWKWKGVGLRYSAGREKREREDAWGIGSGVN